MPFRSKDDADLVQFLRRHAPPPPPPPPQQEEQLMAQLIAHPKGCPGQRVLSARLPSIGIVVLIIALVGGSWWAPRQMQWGQTARQGETWEAFLLSHWWALTEPPPTLGMTWGEEWWALTQSLNP
jgi:hypothetical protein